MTYSALYPFSPSLSFVFVYNKSLVYHTRYCLRSQFTAVLTYEPFFSLFALYVPILRALLSDYKCYILTSLARLQKK